MSRRAVLIRLCTATAFASCFISIAYAQSEHDRKPIEYSTSTPTDRVALLAKAVDNGEVNLEWDEDHGWLKSVLENLKVPTSSQTLVFSKTSLQFRQINPRKPRAVYFSDDVYVGWVNGGDELEIGAVDSKLGAVFYTVAQKKSERPRFYRDRGECLACHDNGRTENVPGFLVRSVFPQASGQPAFRLGTTTTDHTTPMKDRFGGWYVTGSHGAMRHRGNVFVKAAETNDPIDREAGANLSELPTRVRSDQYLESSSDIIGLMLLEHQTQMHNLVTRAGYTCRKAMFQQSEMNRILRRGAEYHSESTTRRINSAAEQLVRYLFFSEEFELTSPIEQETKFAKQFVSSEVRDSKGRSLRDLDLKKRLLRYPCSYLVYTDSFLGLPKPVLDRVEARMLEVLTGEDESEEFSHLSADDRANILEILTETHPLFSKDEGESIHTSSTR